MKPLSDLATLRATLQRGINAGYWSLNTLDTPSSSYDRELREARKSEYFGPTFNPPTPYRNLLRDHSAPEAVQPVNPRDFDMAATTRPNEGQSNVDLLPHQWPPVPHIDNNADLSGDQNAAADGTDHGHQGHLGATGRHRSSDPASDGQSTLEPQPSWSSTDPAPW